MPTYKKGDVVLVYFPYQEDPNQTKCRPAVVVEDCINGNHIVVKCTRTDVSKWDKPCIVIEPGTEAYRSMRLKDRTYISVSEEITLSIHYIKRLNGRCPEDIMSQIAELRDKNRWT